MIKTRRIVMTRRSALCPTCGTACKRHSNGRRRLREIGVTGPTVVEVTYSKHYCEWCRKHFSIGMDHLAPAYSRFTHRVRRTAVELVVSQALTLDKATQRMRQKYFVHIPLTTLHDWIKEALVA